MSDAKIEPNTLPWNKTDLQILQANHVNARNAYEVPKEDRKALIDSGVRQGITDYARDLTRRELRLNPGIIYSSSQTKRILKFYEEEALCKQRIFLITIPYKDKENKIIVEPKTLMKFCRRKCFLRSAYAIETSKSGYEHVHIATENIYEIGSLTVRKYAQSTFKKIEPNLINVVTNPRAFHYISKQVLPIYVKRHSILRKK